MTAVQQGFDFTSARRPKKRGHVRRSSVLTAQAEAPRLAGRAQRVHDWLVAYFVRYLEWPTSAELADDTEAYAQSPMVGDTLLLFVRRGLSDLQAKNVVEAVPGGDRKCRVSRRTCCTWRVKQW